MNKKLIIGTAVLPLALVCATSIARMPGPPSLERFDADDDGRVTRDEIEAVRTAEFAAADSDGDGVLSFAELEALEQQQHKERLAEKFAQLDQDGSGGISAQEFSDGHPQDRATTVATVFGLADLDGDGSLSLDELNALKEAGPAPGDSPTWIRTAAAASPRRSTPPRGRHADRASVAVDKITDHLPGKRSGLVRPGRAIPGESAQLQSRRRRLDRLRRRHRPHLAADRRYQMAIDTDYFAFAYVGDREVPSVKTR